VTDVRCFDPPARKRIQAVLAPGQRDLALVTLVGSWSAADVYLAAPATPGSPWPTCEIKLIGRNSASRVVFDRQIPGLLPGILPGGTEQLVLSVRGRVCDQFQVVVTALPDPRGTPVEAEIVLEVWGDNSQRPLPSDLAQIALNIPTRTSSAPGGLIDQFQLFTGPGVVWQQRMAVDAAGPAVSYLLLVDSAAPLAGGEFPIDFDATFNGGSTVGNVQPGGSGIRMKLGAQLGLSTTPDKFTNGGRFGVFAGSWTRLT
jgi:hypothetical protein